MKQFYDNQDENMRSKMTEHEFGMIPGAWEDMEKRLDKLEGPALIGSWGTWFVIGAMIIATTAGIFYYQMQMPFGKNSEAPIVDLQPAENDVKAPQIAENTTKKADLPQKSAETKNETLPSNTNNVVANTSTVNTSGRILQPAAFNQSVKAENPVQLQKLEKADPALQEPGQAPRSDDHDANGQRPENSSSYPVYTRKVEVIHAFSESYLKWRNENLGNLNVKSSGLGKNTVDTPMLILKNPYALPKRKMTYGLSAGVNTKVYNSNRFSIAPVAGLFARRQLTSRHALQADLQYKLLLNQSGRPESSPRTMDMQVDVDPSTEIQFEDRSAKVYNVKRMHLFELPLSFVYRLHKKHNVSLGINAAYLFGVKTDNVAINSMSPNELGFNSLDLGALAGYEFSINDNFAIALSYNVGFLNLAKNTYKRGLLMNESAQAYQFDAAIAEDESLMPIEVNSEEQIFFEAPSNLYNTDLKILLRYSF